MVKLSQMDKQIISNNQLMAYSEFGRPDAGKALLFLHGWRSSKETWNQVASSMYPSCAEAPEGRQVSSIYAIDLPGFGGSSAPKTAWSVGDYAESIKGFIEKLPGILKSKLCFLCKLTLFGF